MPSIDKNATDQGVKFSSSNQFMPWQKKTKKSFPTPRNLIIYKIQRRNCQCCQATATRWCLLRPFGFSFLMMFALLLLFHFCIFASLIDFIWPAGSCLWGGSRHLCCHSHHGCGSHHCPNHVCEIHLMTNEMKVSVLLLVVTLPFSLCCVIKVVQVVLIANHL